MTSPYGRLSYEHHIGALSPEGERQEERDRARYDAMVDGKHDEFDAALADVCGNALYEVFPGEMCEMGCTIIPPPYSHVMLQRLLDGRAVFPDRDEYVKAGVVLDVWKSFEHWCETEAAEMRG